MPSVLDSYAKPGELTPPIAGATKFDGAKVDPTFCPPEAIAAISRVCEFGAIKYARGAWRHIPNAQPRLIAATMRHLLKFLMGEEIDPETGLPHLDQALTSLAFHRGHEYQNDPRLFLGYLAYTGRTLEETKRIIEEYKK